jgi:hypothetical protein
MMGWWNKLVRDKNSKKVDTTSSKPKMSDKDKATAKGEPWVKVMEIEMNPDNPGEGYFELDWNQPFVEKLRNAGYTGNNDEEIIDLWFTSLCRNIGAEEEYNG